MRSRLMLVLILALGAFALCPTVTATTAARLLPVDISFRVQSDVYTKTQYGRPPQWAVWIESLDGRQFHTLAVTRCSGANEWRGKTSCPVALPYWDARRAGRPDAAPGPVADAVTQPTPTAAFTRNLLLPAGSEWDYFVEVNASGDFNESFPRDADGRSDSPGNGQPSIVYRGRFQVREGMESIPELIGRTDQWAAVRELSTDLAGIDTAKHLISSIRVVCHATETMTADFFVAPDGNDAWSGRLAARNADASDGPVATIERAQQLVRERKTIDEGQPILVAIRGGTYYLDKPLTFGPDDSGTEAAPIIYRAYPSEQPIFSGGRRITNWKVDAHGHWIADLSAEGDWDFTQLFVNDQRRYRPQLPKEGYYKIANEVAPTEETDGRGNRFGFTPGELDPQWTNLGDVEIFAFHQWAGSRLRIDHIDTENHVVTLHGATASSSYWAKLTAGHRYLVMNVREALSEPGQWYLDRPTRALTYIPKEGEHPASTVVIAPRIDNLLLLIGNVPERDWVEHLTFEGITFAHSNWYTPPTGQACPQAEINLGAAIAATGARHCTIEDCVVRHTGEYAIGFGAGCRHNRVERCEMFDLGAGGVKIGSALPSTWNELRGPGSDAEALVSHHTVRDCTIAHGGRMHPAAIGVWIGHSPYNTVEHCDVYDLYYSAFSIGWVWGYGPSAAHHNTLGFNHAHTIGQGVLSDMGCVYTLGISPGTVVHDNHFHDVVSFDYGGWGLYTDEGSTGVVMKNNLVYRCSRGAFHQHYGKENLIENNILAYGGQHQIQRTRTEDHTSFFFERNIVLWDNESPLMGSNWRDNNFKTDYNIYWHDGMPVTFPGGLTLDQWREQRGQDAHSVVVDPGFVDPKNDDFRLKDESVVQQIGFVPFDYSRAGRITPAKEIEQYPPVPRAFE